MIAAGVFHRVIARELGEMSKDAFYRDQWRLRQLIGAVNSSHAVGIGYETGLLRVGEKLWTPPNRTAEVA